MLRFGLIALFAVVVGSSYGLSGLTRTFADAAPSVQKYLGYWNYDQPNLTTLNNIDVMACPDGGGQCDPQLPLPLKIPQVGWVLFSQGPNGTINGHTDQGCTWNFRVTATDLELSSTTQQCFVVPVLEGKGLNLLLDQDRYQYQEIKLLGVQSLGNDIVQLHYAVDHT